MRLQKGDTLQLKRTRLRIASFLSSGIEGEVYRAYDIPSREERALKLFRPSLMPTAVRLERVRFLVQQDFHLRCPALCAPLDYLERNGVVGHVCPYVKGESLEDYLVRPHNPMHENVKLAIAVAHSVSVMHDLQIAHGDLHLNNLMTVVGPSGAELQCIDLDNFACPGVPAPGCVGHDLFMAPELRNAFARKQMAVPDEFSDRFALAGVLHLLLLAKHLATGRDQDPDQLHEAMSSGVWLQDPIQTGGIGGQGYPTNVLNTDLMRMFRRAVSLDPAQRPSAQEWTRVLHDSLFKIFVHELCGGPVFVDPSKTVCPYCNHCYAIRKIVVPTLGREILVDCACVTIGRAQIQSPKVSQRHAVLRRVGPETFLESVGSNGTYRWSGREWVRLPETHPVLIQAGDRLRFANIEAEVHMV